jgi:hypothetical protein
MRKTRKNKIKGRKTHSGGVEPVKNGKNVGDIIIAQIYGANEFGEVKSTRFNKNQKKHLTVQLFNEDKLREISENDATPALIRRRPTLDIACYKQRKDTEGIYDLITEKIPGIPMGGAFFEMIHTLDAFIKTKMEDQDTIDDFVFRAHPTTFYLVDTENECIPKLVNDYEDVVGKYSLNSVYVFKFSLLYGSPTIEFLDYDKRTDDRELEKSGKQVSIVNNSERSGRGLLPRFNVPYSDVHNYFYFPNPYSMYVNNIKQDSPQMDKLLYDDAIKRIPLILQNLSIKYSIARLPPRTPIKDIPMFKKMQEYQKLYKNKNENAMTNYKSKKLSKIITSDAASKIKKSLENAERKYENSFMGEPATFINNVYNARLKRRLKTIKNRTPEEVNIIATSMALSDNVPFFENK